MGNRWKPGLLSPAFGPTISQSTHPESVHPALAAVAGTFNDLLADDHRRLLTPLAPWRGLRAAARVYAGWGFSQAFYWDELYKQLGYTSLEDFLVAFWEGFFLDERDANNLLT